MKRTVFAHSQTTNKLVNEATIPPGLAGKIVKYRQLSEPIRLQDFEDSARSQAWKKIKQVIGRDKGRALLNFKQIDLNERGSLQS